MKILGSLARLLYALLQALSSLSVAKTSLNIGRVQSKCVDPENNVDHAVEYFFAVRKYYAAPALKILK